MAAASTKSSATPFVHAKAVELGKHVFRMTTAAGSGHPSSAMSLAHIVIELMYRQMRHDPGDPWNPNSDRLVLSEGHAVPIVYAAWADLGGVVGNDRGSARRLTVDDLMSLRQLGSELDGHPNPAEGFPFFDAATGSLGQGLSVAGGLALAARMDNIDKRIFCLIGDGESREGQIWEAADFIADFRLASVCAVFNCNGHGQAGEVSPQQSPERLAAKMRAFSWDVVEVDGHDPDQLATALARAGRGERPLAVIARTVKGWGAPSIIGKNYHGKPLTAAELDGVCRELDATGARLGASAGAKIAPARPAPAAPKETKRIELPPFEKALERAGHSAALTKQKLATRVAYGIALRALGDADERVVALDGDVSNSTFSNLFEAQHKARFFECKIGEQNMISAAAGLAAGGKIPFASSFGKFIARAADQVDMAAISRANVKIAGSHCGVSLAADGPSQMAVSDVAYFRSLTRVDNGRGGAACLLFQPSDPVSAYHCVGLMANVDGLCYMRTFRPDAPFLYPFDEKFEIGGCKQLRSGNRLTLVSAGFMLHTVLAAADLLAKDGVACNVFDAYMFPMNAEPILNAARGSGGAILTVEDNYIGGLQAELAEAAAEAGDVRVVGLTANRIPKSAITPEEVFTFVGVGLEQVVERATRLAAR